MLVQALRSAKKRKKRFVLAIYDIQQQFWNSFCFWLKNPFLTRLSSPLSWQPYTKNTGWKMFPKKKMSGNITVSKVYFVQL